MVWQIGAVNHDGAHAQAQGKEGLTHRDQQALAREFGKIRFEEKRHALAEPAGSSRIDVQDDQHQEQSGHHDTRHFFDAFADPAAHDENRCGHEEAMPDHLHVGRRLHLDKSALRGLGRPTVQKATSHLEEVGHGPARYDRIVGKDEKAGQDANPAHEAPGRVRASRPCKLGHGIDGALTSPTTQHRFRHHDR